MFPCALKKDLQDIYAAREKAVCSTVTIVEFLSVKKKISRQILSGHFPTGGLSEFKGKSSLHSRRVPWQVIYSKYIFKRQLC